MANELGLTHDGVKYHITKLKSDGVIMSIGGRSTGEWKIIS